MEGKKYATKQPMSHGMNKKRNQRISRDKLK